MKYSFILPAYKARFFKEALDSILAQTYKDFELIIVNDASPEDLTSVVKSYDDPRIRYYINEENIGGKNLVAQWNHCLEYANGEYVILASDDDLYHLEYLEKMNVLVDKYPEVNVFRPRVQLIDESNSITHIAGVLNEYTSQLEFIYNQETIWSGIPYYIFRLKALKAIGGFVYYPLAWHSDDMSVIRLAQNGLVFCNNTLFSFRVSEENISGKLNNASSLESKANATIQFYTDLQDLLKGKTATNYLEKFYIEKIYAEIFRAKRKKLTNWFEDSSANAALRCLPLYIKCNCFSIRSLIRMFVRKLLTRK